MPSQENREKLRELVDTLVNSAEGDQKCDIGRAALLAAREGQRLDFHDETGIVFGLLYLSESIDREGWDPLLVV